MFTWFYWAAIPFSALLWESPLHNCFSLFIFNQCVCSFLYWPQLKSIWCAHCIAVSQVGCIVTSALRVQLEKKPKVESKK